MPQTFDERNRDVVVSVGGRLTHRDRASISPFESIPSDEEIIEHITQTLLANGMEDNVHIRLTLTRGVKITSGMDPRLNQNGPTLIVLPEHSRCTCS